MSKIDKSVKKKEQEKILTSGCIVLTVNKQHIPHSYQPLKCYQGIILFEVFEEDKKQEEIVTKCVRRWRRNINSSLLQRGQAALCPKGADAFCFQPFLTF